MDSTILPEYTPFPVYGELSLTLPKYIITHKKVDKYSCYEVKNQYLHTMYSLNILKREPIVLVDHSTFHYTTFKINSFLSKPLTLELKGKDQIIKLDIRLPSFKHAYCKIHFLLENVTYYWMPRSNLKWYLILKNKDKWLATYNEDPRSKAFGKLDVLENLPSHHHPILAMLIALIRHAE